MELLSDLRKQDIHLKCVGDKLRVDAPQGALTPELRATLLEQKAALLAWLSMLEWCHCGAEATYYSDQGTPTCEKHRVQYARAHGAASPALAHITQASFFLQDVALVAGMLEGLRRIALDLETTGFDPQSERVISIAFGVPGQVAILDLRPYYALSSEEQAPWKVALQGLLHREGVTWIGHNLKFDWQFLAHHFDVKLAQVYDTMLVEQLLHGISLGNARISLKLKDVAARYGLSVSKEERQWFPRLHTRPEEWSAPFPIEQLRYMVADIETPFIIAEKQQAKIAEHSLESVVEVEHGALPTLAAMELRGVLVDVARWRGILAQKRARMQQLEIVLHAELGKALQQACKTYKLALQEEEKRLMHAYQATGAGKSTWERFRKEGLATWGTTHPQPPSPKAGAPITLSSSPQLQVALAELGIPVDSTREEVLEPYAKERPIVAHLLEWKTLEKFCSAFGENILTKVGTDGRLHTDYAQIGAVSGRIISRSPNLQQIPAHDAGDGDPIEPIKRCFVAPDGAVLLTADLSNIELRILAEVAQDQTMLRLFAEGRDLHAETAKLMFGLPADTNTKRQLYKGNVSVRAVAKMINFGLAYGMGAQGLANRVGVSMEEAKDLMQIYFRTYAGVASWLRATAKRSMQQGYATTLGGRKRWFPTNTLDRTLRASFERAAKNHPIQGTNADIMKRALALLHTALPADAHLLLTVHDEVVVECPLVLVDQVEPCMQECLMSACREFLSVVHIPSPDVVKAAYWKKD
jgi:DNA polymerase I